jgi:hypothetical protein
VDLMFLFKGGLEDDMPLSKRNQGWRWLCVSSISAVQMNEAKIATFGHWRIK